MPTNSQIQNTTNERILTRNVPSQFLQPYLNVRPLNTKYTVMPIVEPRVRSTVPLQQMPVFNPQKVFNPGNTKSPWSGFASAVNTESELRNQIYALQHSEQSVYVPSSKSDLYQYSFTPQSSQQVQQPFPDLFKQEQFNTFNPNTLGIGQGTFNNSTRAQIKNLTGK